MFVAFGVKTLPSPLMFVAFGGKTLNLALMCVATRINHPNRNIDDMPYNYRQKFRGVLIL